MMRERDSMDKELVSESMRARSRKYYFDIKQNRNGNKYITISEKQPMNEKFRRMRIMVFEEYVDEFITILTEIGAKLKELPSSPSFDGNSKNFDDPDVDPQEGLSYRHNEDE